MALGPIVRVQWVENSVTIHAWAAQIVDTAPSSMEEAHVRVAANVNNIGDWVIIRDGGGSGSIDGVNNDIFSQNYTILLYDPNA